jgi:hypothetical protein
VSTAHEDHLAACAVAKAAIVDMQAMVMAAFERGDDALGAVIQAVGDPPQTESGRWVLEFVSKAKQDLTEEVYGVLNKALAELERYEGGF